MRFEKQLEEILGNKLSTFRKEDKLVDIGLDSVRLVQIAGLVEEHVDEEITHEKMLQMDINYLRRVVSKIDSTAL